MDTGFLIDTFIKITSSYDISSFRDFNTIKLKSGEEGTMKAIPMEPG
jgi:hypothetical protein